jgi:hypothetical protein
MYTVLGSEYAIANELSLFKTDIQKSAVLGLVFAKELSH